MDSSGGEATFAALGLFVVTTVERALYIEDCFRVAVWQVLVLNWVSKLELEVPLLGLLPFDFHSWATFHVPFDEAFEQDCDLEESGDSLDSFVVVFPLRTDAGPSLQNDASLMKHADFVVSNEIVAGIVFAVERHEMILERVVGPSDSSKDVGADAVVVAVDDFEVFVSNGIAGFVEYQLEANRQDLDSASVHSSTGPIPYDYSLDVAQTMNESSGVGLHSLRKAVERELVVVASGTFDDHFVDNAEIFSAGLVVDVATEGLIRSLVEESCHSSCSVAKNRPLAFASDLAGNQSCAVDN